MKMLFPFKNTLLFSAHWIFPKEFAQIKSNTKKIRVNDDGDREPEREREEERNEENINIKI